MDPKVRTCLSNWKQEILAVLSGLARIDENGGGS